MFDRRHRLSGLPVCLLFLLSAAFLVISAYGQTPQQQPAPTEQPKPQQPKPPSPFENVPEATEPAKPEQPPAAKPDTKTPTPAAQPGAPAENVIDGIEFRGSRRVPQDTLKALIITKRGDQYSEDTLRRDFMALWNTGRFDDIKLEREAGPERVDHPFRPDRAPRDPVHQVRRQQIDFHLRDPGPV